jgi:hypothetical protein
MSIKQGSELYWEESDIITYLLQLAGSYLVTADKLYLSSVEVGMIHFHTNLSLPICQNAINVEAQLLLCEPFCAKSNK